MDMVQILGRPIFLALVLEKMQADLDIHGSDVYVKAEKKTLFAWIFWISSAGLLKYHSLTSIICTSYIVSSYED